MNKPTTTDEVFDLLEADPENLHLDEYGFAQVELDQYEMQRRFGVDDERLEGDYVIGADGSRKFYPYE